MNFTVERSRFPLLFFAILVVFLAVIDRGQISGDGSVRWNALTLLMEEQKFSAEKYSMVQPLLSVPMYVAADLVASGVYGTEQPGKRLKIIKNVVQRFNKIVVFLVALLFYRLLRKHYQFSEREAALSTVFLLFGSLLIPNARDYYADCLVTLLTAVTLFILCDLSADPEKKMLRRALLLVLLVTVLIPLNPVSVVPLSAVVVTLTIRHFMRPDEEQSLKAAYLLVVGIMFGVLSTMLENYLRRGEFTNFGYTSEGFTTALPHGLLGLTLSATRGVFYFVPTLFFGAALAFQLLPTNKNAGGKLILYSIVYGTALLLAYAKWHHWHGGWGWGPRYLLPLSFFGTLYFVVFVKHRWKESSTLIKGLCVLVMVSSVGLYKVGVVINQRYLMRCLEGDLLGESCYWDYRFLPYRSFVTFEHLSSMALHRSTIVEFVSAALLILLFRNYRTKDNLASDLR